VKPPVHNAIAMKHAILGPGGVGGLMGACLAKIGESVTMVVRPETLEQYPRQLHLESPFGNFTVPIERTSKVPPVDVLWIAVKATQLEIALHSIPTADIAGGLVPLLNGVDHIALLRSCYGAERVLPATIAVEAERVTAGHIVRRSPFCRLSVIGHAKSLLGSTLEQLQQLKFTCPLVDHEPTLLWGKLAFLAPIALTTTAAGATTGQVAADPHWREQLESCVREACAVAQADGAEVEAETGIAAFGSLPAGMRSSMQKDVEQGNPPELDAIAGPILRGAERYDIAVPVTQSLVEAVAKKAGLARVQH
jgi:2-dehydropantoate 2-reductase